jgi:hypothetical protein
MLTLANGFYAAPATSTYFSNGGSAGGAFLIE